LSWTEEISTRIARQIIQEDSTYTVGQVSHGIEIAIIYLLNAAVLIISSLLLGVFTEAILIASLYILHRSFTGGFHLNSVWSCMVGGVLMILLSSLAILNLPDLGPFSYLLILILFVVSFLINYRYAPAEHTYVSTKETIKKLCRKIIVILLIFGCILSEILIYFDYKHLAITYAFSAFLQSLHLHPISYRLAGRFEKLLERIGL
jgi:accessory gene regulator B